ncbi:hypothetical protein BDN72DRAFT_560678 [Pluteus cervinus]|uniref:Uncharacterized protein n=1 Tax=Pluteus cervinus TaxID=181527 RepID=A0ACD3BBW9_9AGAR|nr:hypothetical protein BDN72DRAFT_560678 [Pluteus cervinus]
MFDSPSKAEYEPLAHHLDGETSDDGPSTSHVELRSYSDSSSSNSWSFILPKPLVYGCLVIAALSVLNLALLPATITKYKEIVFTNAELDALDYPTQHLGLDRVKLKHLPNWNRAWPTNIVRISQNLNNNVFGEGTQVFISVQDTTMMRFPIPSSKSGSRACALSFTAPPENTPKETYGTKGDITEIEVWNVLPPDHDIPWSERSQHHRPPRGDILGTMSLKMAMPNATTEDFECPEDELVVELRCLRVACEVQFKQTDTWPKFGFELVRRQ